MFYNKRTKKSISLKVWPFKNSDTAKLYWIDHPYRDNSGDWKIDMYFKKIPEGYIRKCTESWGILSILIIGRFYKGGKLLPEKDGGYEKYNKEYNGIIDKFHFDEAKFSCKEGKHIITTDDNKKHSVYKNAFVTKYNEVEYHIPVFEVIRNILAKNRRLVHSILYPNSLNYFFTVRKDYYEKNTLHMYFTEEYPGDLLSDDHVSHLAWLSTNIYAKKSWNEVYTNYLKYNKGLYFSFPLQGRFDIKARYRQKGNIIRIEEIIYIDGTRTDYKTLVAHSPHIKQIRINNKPKKKSIIQVGNDEGIIINSNNKGMKKKDDIVEIPLADHKFENPPVVKKIPNGAVSISVKEDENTEKVFINNGNEVSTSETREKEIVNGLEFKEPQREIHMIDNDLKLFIAVLNEMSKMYVDLHIGYTINNLPDGKSFSKLEDGVTPRKYILAKITFDNNINKYLIEVERQGKSLSTLMICKHSGVEIESMDIFNSILEGLVNNNGSWNNKVIDEIKEDGFINKRIRHTRINKDKNDLARRLYEKLL